jgi:hypothetical protein
MRRLTTILILLALFLSSYAQNKWVYYNDSNYNMIIDTMSVFSFLKVLAIADYDSNSFYIIRIKDQVKTGWVKASEIDSLILLIDSKEPSYCIEGSYASLRPPNRRSTIGGQVMNLIDSFRLNWGYPMLPFDCATNDEKRKAEILKWYKKFKKGK